MIKIVIFNQKGGVGKSTTVVDIAGCLSKNLKKNVLVVDVDAQCTSTSYLRTIEGPVLYDLHDYIDGTVSLNNIIYPVHFEKWSIRERGYILTDTKISLIPSSRTFAKSEHTENFDDMDLFNKIFDEIGEDTFDYCIFDCPGYISKLTESALRASDFIIVPAIADIDSLVGFSDLIDTKNRIREESNNVGLDILGVIFTMFTGTSLNRQISEFCRAEMGEDIIFNTYIRRSAIIGDARAVGKPIAYYKPSEDVAVDYLTLTKEIVKRIKERRGEK